MPGDFARDLEDLLDPSPRRAQELLQCAAEADAPDFESPVRLSDRLSPPLFQGSWPGARNEEHQVLAQGWLILVSHQDLVATWSLDLRAPGPLRVQGSGAAPTPAELLPGTQLGGTWHFLVLGGDLLLGKPRARRDSISAQQLDRCLAWWPPPAGATERFALKGELLSPL
jgi:hypothetical protein